MHTTASGMTAVRCCVERLAKISSFMGHLWSMNIIIITSTPLASSVTLHCVSKLIFLSTTSYTQLVLAVLIAYTVLSLPCMHMHNILNVSLSSLLTLSLNSSILVSCPLGDHIFVGASIPQLKLCFEHTILTNKLAMNRSLKFKWFIYCMFADSASCSGCKASR